MKLIISTILILIPITCFPYIGDSYDCKMKSFVGIDTDGIPKKWKEQRFSFKWKDDFTIQFGIGGYFDNFTSERIGWFSAHKDSFNIHHDIYIMNYVNKSLWYSHVNPEAGILNIYALCEKRK